MSIKRQRASTSISTPAQSSVLMQRQKSHASAPVAESFTGDEYGHNFGNIPVVDPDAAKPTCASCTKEYMAAEAQQRPVNTGALCPKCQAKGMQSQVKTSWDGMSRANPMSSLYLGPSLQVISGEAEADRHSSDGLLMSLAGSGTCQNGGGSSVCSPTTGNYSITANNNTCCTKSCTQTHEQQHVTDHTGYGCCSALSTAWNKSGANRADLARKYNTWFAQANLVSECNAYTGDVKCADDLAKTKACTGKGKGTDCCKDIADYKQKYAALATSYCARAPKSVPACPSF